MKYLGFIKEHNNIKCADTFSNLTSPKSLEYINLQEIIAYLNKGEILLAWMGYFLDINTKELIAPDSYYTDGIWIWPSYLPYYLSKFPEMSINNEFIKYLEEKNFKMNIEECFSKVKNEIENELSLVLNNEDI